MCVIGEKINRVMVDMFYLIDIYKLYTDILKAYFGLLLSSL